MTAIVKRTDDPQELGNHIGVRCPVCDKPFILIYSDPEWNKLPEWRRLAALALRENHKLRHEEGLPLELVWKATRSKR